MSSAGEVDEEIVEAIEEEDYTDDDELDVEVDINQELVEDTRDGVGNSDEETECKVRSGADNSGNAKDTCHQWGENGFNTVEFLAIEKFSHNLAESLVHEAILINDIYLRDKTNVHELTGGKPEESGGRKNVCETDRNGIPGFGDNKSETGYDSYLIQKFLHSKADPIDVSEDVGFDGKEEHFQTSEITYPGLDRDDEYIKGEMRTSDTDEDMNDTNNNKMAPPVIDPFSDSLQTIHEDAELVIDTCRHEDDTNMQPVTEQVYGDDTLNNGNVEDTTQDLEKADHTAAVTDDSGIGHQENGDDSFKDQDPLDALKEDDKAPDKPDAQQLPEIQENDIGFELDDDPTPDETDCCEMTFKEKKRMVGAVRGGNIDRLETLLEKKNADMSMIWYGENLLMVAIRAGKQEMAEFLVDNGIDWNYQANLMEVGDKGTISIHKKNSRQMAYDCNMAEFVEFLDQKSNNLFPFIRPKPRDPRLREPILPFAPPPLDEGIRESRMVDPKDVDGLVAIERERLRVLKSVQEIEEVITTKNKENAEDGKGKKRKSGTENDSVHTKSCSDLNISNDELSQVFGPDEGYETMSPVSPFISHIKYDYNIPDLRQTVSVRGTRASSLVRAHNASKVESLRNKCESAKNGPHSRGVDTIGSYNFESRKWQMPRSAPPSRNCSTPGRPDSVTRVGLPALHGHERNSSTPDFSKSRLNRSVDGNQNFTRARTAGNGDKRNSCSSESSLAKFRSKSAHGNVSPYSQVAKLLEQSRLFSPLPDSRPTHHFPSIKKNSVNKDTVSVTKTRINYIYAGRSSAVSKCGDLQRSKTDLLPKRKLKC